MAVTRDVDVLVIGGGAAGVGAARGARDEGASVAMVREAAGATGMTGGVVWGVARDPFRAWAGDAFRVGGRFVTPGGWVIAGAQGGLSSLFDLDVIGPGDTWGVVDMATHPSWSAALLARTFGAKVVRGHDVPQADTFRETAVHFDSDGMAEAIATSIQDACKGLRAVLFPPVLGMRRHDVAARMTSALGIPVGEAAGVAGDPPSVRLSRAVMAWMPAGVDVLVARATVHAGKRASVTLDAGDALSPKTVVLATGGLAGGGLVFDGALTEATAGAPVWTRRRERVTPLPGSTRGADPMMWFDEQTGRVHGAGVRVDGAGRVLDAEGAAPWAPWLFAAGEVCGGPEGTGLSDALASGLRVGREAARAAKGG